MTMVVGADLPLAGAGGLRPEANKRAYDALSEQSVYLRFMRARSSLRRPSSSPSFSTTPENPR